MVNILLDWLILSSFYFFLIVEVKKLKIPFHMQFSFHNSQDIKIWHISYLSPSFVPTITF